MSTESITTRSEPMATAETLIADYLDRLRRASAELPAGPRAELLDDITAHLAERIDGGADEAHVRQVLDELGAPEEIAAAAAAESGPPAPVRNSGELTYDVATVLVLLLGGFVIPVLGWIAGVVMLWNGPRWDSRQKWTGTLIWPAAFIVVGGTLVFTHATAGNEIVVFLIALVLAIAGLAVGFAYLLRAAARPLR